MTDTPVRIPPQRARAAMTVWLRDLADAVEAGEIQYVFFGALNTPEGAKEHGHAIRQAHGYVGRPDEVERFFWVTPLGMARSVYLDVEDQLINVGAGTLGAIDSVKA